MSPTRRWVTVQLGILGLAVLFPCGVLHAQGVNGQGAEEIRLMREAEAHEAAGDFAEAQKILEAIVGERPTAVTALLALERVLRIQGRPADLLAPVDRLLDADPTSAIGNRLRLQLLSELGRVEELEEAAEAWMQAAPRVETPYREIAKIWSGRGDHARAARVLERGRSQLKRDDALALELGETYAVLRGDARAFEEWSRAIGPDARGFSLVRRRLRSLPDGGARLLPGLIESLTQGRTTVSRRRAAVDLAIDAGLADRAEAVARTIVPELSQREREGFLVEVARRADGAHLPTLAYWAYGELLAAPASDEPLLALRTRLAELALAVGDTVTARENFRIIEQAYAAGSPERRQAVAVRIELTAREGKVDDALRELDAFRSEFSEAPELDRLVAAVGDALLRSGKPARAEELIGTTRGPRTHLLRGRIALQRGEVTDARRDLMRAAAGLEGGEATEVLSLVTLLGRVSAEGGELLGSALARGMQGNVPGAIMLLVDGSEELDRGERAAILDFAAGLADRAELPAESERIRRLIALEYPDTPEAPAALLELGRELGRRPGAEEEARSFLERIVLDYPRSTLVPQARQELSRLRGRVPRN